MANPAHVELVNRGAEAIRDWKRANPGGQLELSEANLRGCNLIRADLSRANLRGASLIGTDLREASLTGADLSSALLIETCLVHANLSGSTLCEALCVATRLDRTDLSGANLSDAILNEAYFSEADLTYANMSSAQLGWTSFANVDLRSVRNLDKSRHVGASHIGTDTLVRSQGTIPEVFLRGCGLAPWEILQARMYDPALTPYEISELQIKIFEKRTHGSFFLGGVFISYSQQDTELVDRIHRGLQDAGAPTWLDRHDMVAGPIQKQVSRAIRLNDIVLLVLSEHSIASDWVENELEIANEKERSENRDVLCPIALDDSWKAKLNGADTPDRQLWRKLKHKNVLDFSDASQFESQFAKLLSGLKIYYPPKR